MIRCHNQNAELLWRSQRRSAQRNCSTSPDPFWVSCWLFFGEQCHTFAAKFFRNEITEHQSCSGHLLKCFVKTCQKDCYCKDGNSRWAAHITSPLPGHFSQSRVIRSTRSTTVDGRTIQTLLHRATPLTPNINVIFLFGSFLRMGEINQAPRAGTELRNHNIEIRGR